MHQVDQLLIENDINNTDKYYQTLFNGISIIFKTTSKICDIFHYKVIGHLDSLLFCNIHGTDVGAKIHEFRSGLKVDQKSAGQKSARLALQNFYHFFFTV